MISSAREDFCSKVVKPIQFHSLKENSVKKYFFAILFTILIANSVKFPKSVADPVGPFTLTFRSSTKVKNVRYGEILQLEKQMRSKNLYSVFEKQHLLSEKQKLVLSQFIENGSSFLPKPVKEIGYIDNKDMFHEYVGKNIPSIEPVDAVVVIPFAHTTDEGLQVYVHEHRESNAYGHEQHYWSFPGGKVSKDQPLSGALNELYTESGFQQLPESIFVHTFVVREINGEKVGYLFVQLSKDDLVRQPEPTPVFKQYWPFRLKVMEEAEEIELLFPRPRGDFDSNQSDWASCNFEKSKFVDISKFKTNNQLYSGRFNCFQDEFISEILKKIAREATH